MLHTADTFTLSILSSGMLILSNCGRIQIAINSKPLYSRGLSALQGLSGLLSLVFMNSKPGRSAQPPFMNTTYTFLYIPSIHMHIH